MKRKPRLLVDGIFFQLNDTGIARLWRTVLPSLAEELSILLLDRGNAPFIEGVEMVPFPSHTFEHTAAESALIEEFCEHYSANVFTSTYYTTPLATPMLLLIYDMVPEVMNFDLSHRAWQEKELAICFALQIICISNNTRNDLLRFYNKLNPADVFHRPCGIDRTVFKRTDRRTVEAFRSKHRLTGDYFLSVGVRHAATNYKNVQHLFDAVSRSATADYTIVCIGGEEEVPKELQAADGTLVRVLRLKPDDEELVAAYSGAAALVYPSLYEGFGLPVLEAMACECPVITTHRGALEEVAGDAAFIISGTSVEETSVALERIRQEPLRQDLIRRGLERVRRFTWEPMIECILDRVHELSTVEKRLRHQPFLLAWSELRRRQADVDF